MKRITLAALSLVGISASALCDVKKEEKYLDELLMPPVRELKVLNEGEYLLRSGGVITIACSDPGAGKLVSDSFRLWWGTEVKPLMRDGDGTFGDEEYALSITKDGIAVRSKSLSGVRHALMTIRQLAEAEHDVAKATTSRVFPLVEINDAPANKFRAKLRAQNIDGAMWTKSGMMFLPSEQKQCDGDAGILIEAENAYGIEYQFPDCKLQKDGDRVSVIDARFLQYRFVVKNSGKYHVWYEATYPTTLGYLHCETMDGGDAVTVYDSVNLPPNAWRWHKGPAYELAKGEHVWTFPSPGAWCGKTKLDRMMFLPEGMHPAQACAKIRSNVETAKEGTVTLRRIKASLLSRWQFNAIIELNSGIFTAEYRYDSGEWKSVTPGNWENVPDDATYLHFRLRLRKGEDATISPFAKNISLMVEEK